MTTPYETALRALGREVDDRRTAVRAAADRLSDAQTRRKAVADAIAHEGALAEMNAIFSSYAYLQRAGAEHDRLTALCAEADTALDAARAQARESFGSLRVVQTAADGYRGDADRAAATAEQARIDDFAGARFARAVRPSRRGTR